MFGVMIIARTIHSPFETCARTYWRKATEACLHQGSEAEGSSRHRANQGALFAAFWKSEGVEKAGRVYALE